MKSGLENKLDTKMIERLVELQGKYGLSPSGEGGEIETTVLDAPMFKKENRNPRIQKRMQGQLGGVQDFKGSAGAKMILVVDMNWKKDSLGYYEFVTPILAVAEKSDKCRVKHYLEVSKQDLDKCDRIILSGTALKDNAFLSKPEKFQWLKETEKPVLGICAGMEIIGLVFGATLKPVLEIGMTPDNHSSEETRFSTATLRLIHFTAFALSQQMLGCFGEITKMHCRQ